jgi:site-specific recombinase XerD
MTPSITSRVVSGVRVADGPLCQYLDIYRSCAEQLGYESNGVHCRLRFIAKLDLWLRRKKQPLRELDEKAVAMFLAKLRQRQPRNVRGARATFRQLLVVLREAGAIPPRVVPAAPCPALKLAGEYRRFAKEQRGLVDATVHNYARHVDRFLVERFGRGPVDLERLAGSDITTFIRNAGGRFSRGKTAQIVTGMRSFLRFARFRDYIKRDLAVVVPAVANWALAGLPKYLPQGAVQKVLRAVDRSSVRGKRNYAIFLLLARLGLRAGEIVAMRLEDIDWANAEITVRSRKGAGWARMPLPTDVGSALAHYFRVRPASPHRNAFVRDYAPYSPFVAAGPVSVLVRQALEKAGVKSARTGAHVFRHTLATEMLRHGASMDEIGQVLRHRDPDSTAIYAKVDIKALRQLALPWPGGVR